MDDDFKMPELEIPELDPVKAYHDAREKLYKEHRLTGLFLEVTSRCNARCEHCGSSCGDFVPKDEITKEELLDVLDDVSSHYDPRCIMLFVTGGEPLVRKDLFEVMAYANKLGFPWGMTTNGILIDEDVVQKMVDTNMKTVSVSIDGLKETHESFRKVPGSYEKILKGLRLMLDAPSILDVQVTTCVNKKNIDELPEILKVVKDLGIKNWRIIEVDPIGRAKGNTDLLLDEEGYQRTFDFLFKTRRENPDMRIMYACGHYLGNDRNQRLTGGVYRCFTGYEAASILSNGDIFGCPDIERRPELIEGNIRKDKFSDVWENGFKRYRTLDRTSNEKCKACSEWDFCLGDAFHTWDFENNKPNFCYREIFKKENERKDALLKSFYERKAELEKEKKKKEKTTKKSTKSKKKTTKKK